MFGNDNKDWERWKNFSLFNVWATDKEVEEAAPIGCLVIIIVAVVGLIIWICS